ncbi:hypothetical protein [Streptomyces lavendofoliae]
MDTVRRDQRHEERLAVTGRTRHRRLHPLPPAGLPVPAHIAALAGRE